MSLTGAPPRRLVPGEEAREAAANCSRMSPLPDRLGSEPTDGRRRAQQRVGQTGSGLDLLSRFNAHGFLRTSAPLTRGSTTV